MATVAPMIGETTPMSLREKLRVVMEKLWPSVLFYSLLLIVAIIVMKVPNAKDYVGADNDDGMRLVEVRDFLNGQGWFDLMQYRMGLGPGTLMHWSRLIDLPIATLIRFFGLVLPQQSAEAAALLVWPLSLIVPSLWGMGLAGRRVGGVFGMHIALLLATFLLVTSNRFLPGSIDHHNAQFALAAIMTAMLLDEDHRPLSYAIAAFCAALAIAIGAETTPFVAGVCLVVAISWAWEGDTVCTGCQGIRPDAGAVDQPVLLRNRAAAPLFVGHLRQSLAWLLQPGGDWRRSSDGGRGLCQPLRPACPFRGARRRRRRGAGVGRRHRAAVPAQSAGRP
jgi:hypothetical protein